MFFDFHQFGPNVFALMSIQCYFVVCMIELVGCFVQHLLMYHCNHSQVHLKIRDTTQRFKLEWTREVRMVT